MFSWLRKLFSVEFMVKKEDVIGDIPSSKEAYSTMFDIAWPSALEAVLVSIISSVDTMMVGGIGPHAIAAIGITNQPKFIVLAVILSLNIGVTAVVSRRRGAHDQEGAISCLKQSLLLCGFLSIVMAFFGFTYGEAILRFAGAGEDIIGISSEYLRIIMIGNVFHSIALTINAAQRGTGNTKISMKSNLLANVVNLIFNYLLINGIGPFPMWGTKGAAIATVFGNFCAFALAFQSITVRGRFLYIFGKESWKFDKATIRSISAVSSSAMIEQVFMRIGFFMNTKLVAELGTMVLATYQICMNILNITFCFGDGLGVASSSLVGQSLGAKRPDKAMMFGKVGQRVSLLIGCVLCISFMIFQSALVELFTVDAEIIALGATLMILTGLISPIMTSAVVFSGCLRGAGDVKFTAVVSLISIAIVRPLATYVLCYPLGLGVQGAWIAICIDQLCRLVLSSRRFYGGKWSKISL